MMGMVMKEGRMPRNENEVAINETYGEWMHWGTELLNRTVNNSGYVCKVVGVIKDFRIGNFTNPQAPFILMSTKNYRQYGSIALFPSAYIRRMFH